MKRRVVLGNCRRFALALSIAVVTAAFVGCGGCRDSKDKVEPQAFDGKKIDFAKYTKPDPKDLLHKDKVVSQWDLLPPMTIGFTIPKTPFSIEVNSDGKLYFALGGRAGPFGGKVKALLSREGIANLLSGQVEYSTSYQINRFFSRTWSPKDGTGLGFKFPLSNTTSLQWKTSPFDPKPLDEPGKRPRSIDAIKPALPIEKK